MPEFKIFVDGYEDYAEGKTPFDAIWNYACAHIRPSGDDLATKLHISTEDGVEYKAYERTYHTVQYADTKETIMSFGIQVDRVSSVK